MMNFTKLFAVRQGWFWLLSILFLSTAFVTNKLNLYSETVNQPSLTSPVAIICNDSVQISLGPTCVQVVTPDMILEGTYPSYADFTVEIKTPAGQVIGNTLTAANVGQTLISTITQISTGNYCQGVITVEDKLAPTIIACQDVTINCAVRDFKPEDLALLGLPGAFPNNIPFPNPNVVVNSNNTYIVKQPLAGSFENCSDVTLYYNDTWSDLACGSGVGNLNDVSGFIHRVWVVRDASGNQTSCAQNIYFKRIHALDVTFPTDTILSCENANTAPASTGVPYVSEFGQIFPLIPGTYCELGLIYHDQIIPVCDGTYKILRTWEILDWCLPLNATPPNPNPVLHIQLIKVVDDKGPVLSTCPPDITIATNPYDCTRDYNLPDIIVSDACSRIASVDVRYSFGGIWHTLPGTLETFLGNNPWNPDTLAVFPVLEDLPQAVTLVQYIVTDDCGNSSTCQFSVTVDDVLPPVAVCKKFVVDSLQANGFSYIPAVELDNGSYANCSDVFFKARRLLPNDCQDTSMFHRVVGFCCEDIGDTVLVVFRAYDVVVPDGSVPLDFEADDANDCIVKVLVVDGSGPTCTPPTNRTVNCEQFDPMLNAYGNATTSDNCGVASVIKTVDYQQFDTMCNRGTITRNFTVKDNGGLVTTCSQKVFVSYLQNYWLRFPNDVIVTACNPNGLYGEPVFNRIDCERMSSTYTDQIISTGVLGACYRIERNWRVFNDCTYNPSSPCVNVPNPTPFIDEDNPGNLIGPTVSPLPPTTSGIWVPTSVRLTPTAFSPTNFSTYWSTAANCYTYKQLIKIKDSADPVIQTCIATACDETANDPLLWNNPSWYDPLTGSQDLQEAPTELSFSTRDDCSGTNISISGLLFLNLDGDTIRETVLRTIDFPLNPGTINYDNYQNANYTGGAVREFDQRPVPVNQKYRFALQQSLVAGHRRAVIRWNTLANPTDYLKPQLPPGNHRIEWTVQDQCGNIANCYKNFTVKDCKAPVVVCGNGLTVNLSTTIAAVFYPADFYISAEDNYTPANQLAFGLRLAGNGTGFPQDTLGVPINQLSLNCNNLGLQKVEVWVKDHEGNSSFCESKVKILDNGACGANAAISGAVQIGNGAGAKGVGGVTLLLNGTLPSNATFLPQTFTTDSTGGYLFPVLPDGSFSLGAEKNDDPLNGVSTYDLLLISKHILGTEPFNSPYKIIAADANESGNVSTFDILELRKLILGLAPQLASGKSWRFVDATLPLDLSNPFGSNLDGFIDFPNLSTPKVANFRAIKIGDVNENAATNSLTSSDDRDGNTLLVSTDNQNIEDGDIFEQKFTLPVDVAGTQFTLPFRDVEVLSILPGKNLSAQNFALFADKNLLTFSADQGGQAFFLECRALKNGSSNQFFAISDKVTRAEAYSANGTVSKLALSFASSNTQSNQEKLKLKPVSPNPITQTAQVSFWVPEHTPVVLTICNANGRTVRQINYDAQSGWNNLTLNAAELETGVLTLRVETGAAIAVEKIVVIADTK